MNNDEEATISDESAAHLRRFVSEGILNETHKKALKRYNLIEYTYGSWSLSEFGVIQAKRLGYL